MSTAKSIHLSAKLSLPLRFMELRTVIFGGSGSGKTTAGRVLFEEATSAGVLAGAIDLKSDWWGLKSTTDGKGEGIPIVVFGGEHGDVPIDPEGGAALAEIIVDLQQPFVIDLEELSKAKQMRFLAAFFERLYDKNRKPLVLFCDEADRYAPQKPMTPESNFCLGAVEDIAKRGRKHGVFPVFITQRNASLNKNVSELCDVAIVFRTAGPRDQDAVKEWFNTKATQEQLDVVMKNLAGMETGEAVVCSAHPTIRLFEKTRIRLPRTFDSSATPTIGGRAAIAPKKLARPDLELIQKQMAATIQRADEEDPRKLRMKIAQLQRELAQKPMAMPTVKERIVEVPVIDKALFTKFESSVMHLLEVGNGLMGALRANSSTNRTPAPVSFAAKNPQPVAARPVPSGEVGRPISGGERKILIALAQYPSGKSKRQVAVLTGYASGGGAFNNYLSSLRSQGHIAGKDHLQITQSGLDSLGDFEPLPVGKELQDYWLGQLAQAEKCILQALIAAYPQGAGKDDIAAATAAYKSDGQPYASNGGGFNNAISRLRTLELIEGSKDNLRASDTLFE